MTGGSGDRQVAARGEEYAHSVMFDEALAWAADKHRGHFRKALPGEPSIPYLTHLLETASLGWSAAASWQSRHWSARQIEEIAVAALLHDVLEDIDSGLDREIEQAFGPAVLAIVRHCTDGSPGQPRNPETWELRKRDYLTRMTQADDATLVVSWADKVSNARAIVTDLEAGRDVMSLFNAPTPDHTVSFYRNLAELYHQRFTGHPQGIGTVLLGLVDRMAVCQRTQTAWTGYATTELRIGAPFELSVIAEGPGSADGEFPLAQPAFIITAHNPMSGEELRDVNDDRNAHLERQLSAMRISWVPCDGVGTDPSQPWGPEAGYLLHDGINEQQALWIGAQHGQLAIYRWDATGLHIIECLGARRTTLGFRVSPLGSADR
jgi:hypothetical protein